MKYIRTKYGIYEKDKVSCDEKFVYKYEVRPIWQINQDQEEIINQANTIEELCDEFRGIWINYYESEKKDAHEEYHYNKEKNVFYNDFEELTAKETIEKFDIFYGAIWTDKGLIYVAKMNKEGVLCLI